MNLTLVLEKFLIYIKKKIFLEIILFFENSFFSKLN